MAIETVAVVGANGTLGSKIFAALVAEKTFKVSVVQRSSSSSQYEDGVQVLGVDDDFSFARLKEVFTGQDAVVSCFRLSNTDQHVRIAEAAAAAGVRRFIPADFGSCDADSAYAQELVPLYINKVRVRRRAQELSEEHENFTWTGLVCGHFFDWGLKDGFLHVHLAKQHVDILDGGKYKASYSTLHRVAEAVVRVLQRAHLDETRNKTLFMQSFCVTQLDVLKALEQTTGTKWDVDDVESKAFVEEEKKKAESGHGAAIEELVYVLGTVEADWTKRDDFAMTFLGLEDEDLDKVVAQIVANPTM